MTAPALTGALRRHAVQVLGSPGRVPVVLAHGFGTDSSMWQRVVPALADDRQVVLFDHVGAGRSDLSAHRPDRHASLRGYAADVVGLLDELRTERGIGPVAYVGHSAGAMIGLLAAAERPDLFRGLVTIGGSARYLDDDGYSGGFTRADVDGLLEAMETNYPAWSRSLAPLVMGNPDRPELADELAHSFARTESRIAVQFARAIFLSDHRADVRDVRTPVLVVQPGDDPMVPETAALALHESLPGSRYVRLSATGHFPHISGPDETTAVLREFLDAL